MNPEIIVLILSFVILLLARVPIAFCLIVSATLCLLLSTGFTPVVTTVVQQTATGIDSFVLLAIPFFILAGDLMMSGRFGEYLIRFSKLVVGHLKGGLAQVSVIGSLMFGGVSGSAVADASALGNAIIPVQKKEGYPAGYPAAVNAASFVGGVMHYPPLWSASKERAQNPHLHAAGAIAAAHYPRLHGGEHRPTRSTHERG